VTKIKLDASVLFALNAKSRIESVIEILQSLEQFFPHARDQALLRAQARLMAARTAGDEERAEEIEFALSTIKTEWESRFRAYFYGSVAVLLWSEFEAIIERFAETVQQEENVAFTLRDVKGRSTYSRFRKYIARVLGSTLPATNAVEDLQFLRNLYAHHGGEISTEPAKRKNRIRAIAGNLGVTLKHAYPQFGKRASSGPETYLIVDADYIKRTANSLFLVIDRLREVLPVNE
jgi:hypothetical protein